MLVILLSVTVMRSLTLNFNISYEMNNSTVALVLLPLPPPLINLYYTRAVSGFRIQASSRASGQRLRWLTLGPPSRL
jgi:hypothetical protein